MSSDRSCSPGRRKRRNDSCGFILDIQLLPDVCLLNHFSSLCPLLPNPDAVFSAAVSVFSTWSTERFRSTFTLFGDQWTVYRNKMCCLILQEDFLKINFEVFSAFILIVQLHEMNRRPRGGVRPGSLLRTRDMDIYQVSYQQAPGGAFKDTLGAFCKPGGFLSS